MDNRSETPMDPFRAFMDAGASEPFRQSVLHQMERFWEGQRKWLNEYESFARAMLDRRRSATEATLDTLRKMSSSTDGAEWVKCCSDWFADSLTRVAEDGRDVIQEGMKVLAEVSQDVTAGTADAAKAVAQQAGARGSAAAEQGAGIAQEAARIAAARAPQRPKRPEEGARA